MRSWQRPTRIVARTIAALTLFACTTARADDFSDFRIPRHDVLSWIGALSANGSQTTQDAAPLRTLSGSLTGNAHSYFDLQRTDDIATTRLSMSLRLEGNRTGNESKLTSGLPAFGIANVSDSRDSRRAAYEDWSLSVRQTRQLATAWYVDANASATGSTARNWGDVFAHATYTSPGHLDEHRRESDARNRQDVTRVGGSIGAGFGRVRDVTGIHMALVMEARLKQRGVLARALSHEARQRLADLFVVASAYDRVRSRPGRGIWTEIERVLREDGALSPAGLDVPSAERARESQYPFEDTYRRIDGLPEAFTTRWIGWRVGPVLGGSHSRSAQFARVHELLRDYADGALVNLSEYTDSQNDVETTDDASLGLNAEWHRPLGSRWQADANAVATRPLRSQDDGFEASARATAVWAITDRWYATGGVGQRRSLLKDARTGRTWSDSWQFILSGALRYEIDDHLQVMAGVTEGQNHFAYQAPLGSPQPESYIHSRSFSLGLTYRFAGRFFSPNFPAMSGRVHSDPVL